MVGNGKIGKQTINEETDLSSKRATASKQVSKQAKTSKDSSDDSNVAKAAMEDLSSSVKNVTSKASHVLKQGMEKVQDLLDVRDEGKAAEAKERSAGLKRHKGHSNVHERIERGNL